MEGVFAMRNHARRLLALLLACAAVMGAALAAPLEEGVPVELTSPRAMLLEADTGTVIFEKNADEKRQVASVTKLMTLLICFEELEAGRVSLEDDITVSQAAAAQIGSQALLDANAVYKLRDLLHATIIASANDAAYALAEHIAGSEAAFVEQMNQRAAELGMESTFYTNPTGLPDSRQYTTARDVAALACEVCRHPDYFTHASVWMDTLTHPGGRVTDLTNTNRLVRFYNGATGLKTGSTSSAGCCISATAVRDGMELIAVILTAPTSPQRFEDAKALLDYGFASCALAAVYPDAPLSPIPVVLGESAQVQPVLQRDCRLLVARGEEGQITTRVTLPDDLEAPVEQDQLLGQMEVYVGDELRDTVPILAGQPVARLTPGGIFSRLLRQLLMAE